MKLGILTALLILGTACAAIPDSPGEGAQGSPGAMIMKPEGSADASRSPVSWRPDLQGAELEPCGRPCGTSLCKDNHYCCNESCGICAPRGGVCIQRQCGPAALPLGQCASNDDCRVISNYCDGCQCLPGNVLDPEPICLKPLVACFVDPCRGKYAACLEGQCKLMEN